MLEAWCTSKKARNHMPNLFSSVTFSFHLKINNLMSSSFGGNKLNQMFIIFFQVLVPALLSQGSQPTWKHNVNSCATSPWKYSPTTNLSPTTLLFTAETQAISGIMAKLQCKSLETTEHPALSWQLTWSCDAHHLFLWPQSPATDV